MSFTFSEEFISKKLHEAIQAAGPSSDGFSEVTLNEDTRVKCAAVLVPLIWQDNEWHLLFTRRTNKVEAHKGQVSFPGGACDDGETTPEEAIILILIIFLSEDKNPSFFCAEAHPYLKNTVFFAQKYYFVPIG